VLTAAIAVLIVVAAAAVAFAITWARAFELTGGVLAAIVAGDTSVPINRSPTGHRGMLMRNHASMTLDDAG
jgi:hypothetical protein